MIAEHFEIISRKNEGLQKWMRGCYLVVVVSVLGFICFRLGCLDKPDYFIAVTAESMYDARMCSANYGTFPWEISTAISQPETSPQVPRG